MEIIIPEFQKKFHPAGTYKITFDDKWFYIGSSKNLRNRFGKWKFTLKTGEGLKQKNIKIILSKVSQIRFEILKIYVDISLIRNAENRLLKKYWPNKFLLNRCPDANSPKNLRPYNGYVRPIKINKTNLNDLRSKKVALYNVDFKLIEIYPSLGSISRRLNCKPEDITKYMKGKRGIVKGFNFKFVSASGEFIDPIKFIKKKRPLDIISPTARKINRINDKGEIITTYKSIKFAALDMKCSKTAIGNVLSNRCGAKKVKGFYFKYA